MYLDRFIKRYCTRGFSSVRAISIGIQITGAVTASPKQLKKDSICRIAKPEEIAGAVIFLASSAARMVTAQVICVDGGYTAI